MYYYEILVQFAKQAKAPKFCNIENLVDLAVSHFNARSLLAANPKQIVETDIIDGGVTLRLVLESTIELQENMASRSLRILSQYLIENGMDKYITGKRLLKTVPKKLDEYSKNDSVTVPNSKEKSKLDEFEELGIEDKLLSLYQKLLDIEMTLKTN